MNKSLATNSVLVSDQKHQPNDRSSANENANLKEKTGASESKTQISNNSPQNKQEAIAWVLNLNKPPFPISPQQSLLNNKEPKQPGLYKSSNHYQTLNWKSYQDWHKLDKNLRNKLVSQWHKDKRIEGVSTLGGFNGKHWLGWVDFDVQDFNSVAEMEEKIANWINKYPIVNNSPHFTTPSGGHRFLLAWKVEPQNFGANNGFSLIKDSTERMGELLTKNGGQTIIPPTIGVNGKPYQWINFVEYPPIVNSPEEVGIFPLSRKTKVPPKAEPVPSTYKGNNSYWSQYLNKFEFNNRPVPLEVAIAPSNRELIDSGVPEGSRDNTAAAIARDLVGTYNYLLSEGQAVDGTPEELLQQFGDRCSPPLSDADIDRILNSAQRSNPQPSLDYYKIKSCVASYFWRNGDKSRFTTSKNSANPQHTQTSNVLKVSSRTVSSNPESNSLSLEDAVELARATLTKGLDDLSLNIKLEKIRTQTSTSQSFWDRKIIAPLKRELEGDRFKADLKLILQEEDKIEQLRKIAQLASRYQMSAGTIKAALETMKAQIVTPELKALSLTELFNLESTELDWLVPSFIPKNETVILAGSPKAGKTLLAIDLAFAIATGEDYALGQTVAGGKKVLIVEADESPQSTKNKLLERGFRERDNKLIKVLNNWNISQIPQLERLLEDFRPDLVIIDSLRRINHGSELSENSAEFADNIYTLKETLQRYGASGILIHHTNKNPELMGVNKLRGSSAIAGAVWGTITLDHIPKPDPNNKKKLIIDPRDPKRVLNLHARDAEGQSLQIELNLENNSWSVLGEVGVDEALKAERESLRQRILNVLDKNPQPLGGRDIIECLNDSGINPQSVYATLNRLVNQKVITSKPAPGDRRYTIYYLSKTTAFIENDGGIEEKINTPPELHNPPPPPPRVEIDNNLVENHDQYVVEDRQQYITLDNKLDNTSPMLSNLQFITINSNQETTMDIEIDNKLDNIANTEGGGVATTLEPEAEITPVIENEEAQLQVGERVIVKSQKAEGQIAEFDEESGLYAIKYADRPQLVWEGRSNLARITTPN